MASTNDCDDDDGGDDDDDEYTSYTYLSQYVREILREREREGQRETTNPCRHLVGIFIHPIRYTNSRVNV